MNNDTIYVACGIMLSTDNRIFMGKRSDLTTDPGKWEFPGGKQEQGESIQQCLHREWKEELNVNIEIITLLPIKSQMDKYCCRFFIGQIIDMENIQMRVHCKTGFFLVDDALQLDIYEEDKQILEYVREHCLKK
jgi:mutator protein MutT